MQDKALRERIIALINKNVVPAIGCTEPMAVALCTARATEELGCRPENIRVSLSANILKNAMGVGIPGTGMIGLPIAVALGAIVGRSEYKLEVLKDVTPEAIEKGKIYIDEKRISISQKKDTAEKLYIEVTVTASSSTATVIISGTHTNIVYIEKDGKTIVDKRHETGNTDEDDDLRLDMKTVYDFATTAPQEEIRFILATMEYNMKAAKEAL